MKIKHIIEYLDSIDTNDPGEMRKAIDELKERLNTRLKKVEMGQYIYLYEVEYERDGQTKERIKNQFARIPKNIYKEYEDQLENLRTKKDIDGLKVFLKQLKSKGGKIKNDQ